jgi:uncharacterized RDD family membrane protein YckC
VTAASGTAGDGAGNAYPGAWLGLPAAGVGSVASMGARVGGFVIDIVLCALVGWAFTAPDPPQNLSLFIWAGMTVLAVGAFGFTPGQAAVGIRVARIDGRSLIGLWAVPRTALIFLIVPPLVVNEDGRGWHDRVCRTIVVRMR